MKRRSPWICLLACLVPLLGARAAAAVISLSFNNLNQSIPDGSSTGTSSTQSVSTVYDEIVSMTVTLHVTGGFNGDLYVVLAHGSGVSVLMNRVGRSATNEFGYEDGGVQVQFSDAAPQGDIHQYRFTLSGNHNTALPGVLTGAWGPDARLVDPSNVTGTEPRTAGLEEFTGSNPNGDWTLYLVDLEGGGGVAMLRSWGLEITVVPEPALPGLLVAGAAIVALRRRRSPAGA